MKEKHMKRQNGITLIALVISVIVLLILAGVAVSMISGQDGLFNKANTAQSSTNIANEKEAIKHAFLMLQLKEQTEGEAINTNAIKTALRRCYSKRRRK